MKKEKMFLILLIVLFSLSPLTGEAQKTATGWYKEGVGYFNAGNYDLALESLTKSIELDPAGNPDAYFYRAKAYESLGQHENAATDFFTSCEMGSTHCAEAMPDKLLDQEKLPKGDWSVGDFGYHIDSEGESTYGPANAVDGRPETAWVTRDDPSHVFEDMMIGFTPSADTTVNEFTVLNGYCKSRDLWEKNSRVKRMLVFIHTKPVATVTLTDTMDPQTFSLGKGYDIEAGDLVSFLILETYPGTKYKDIAISELHPGRDVEGYTKEEGAAKAHTVTKFFNAGDAIFLTPIAANGILYVTGRSGVLFAVDLSTGKQLWRFASGNGIGGSPRVADGIVHFGNMDGILFALNAESGQEIWRSYVEGAAYESPTVIGGVVYYAAGSVRGKLYALEAQSGKELWRFDTTGSGEFPLCFADGVIFFGSDEAFYAVDAKTGQQLWRFEAEGKTRSRPTAADGVVYFGDIKGNLYALKTQTGAELWRFRMGRVYDSSPLVTGGAVYVGGEDGILYAVETKGGRELWRLNTGTGNRRCYSAIVVDDVVYFVSGAADNSWDDTLRAVDAHTGGQLWSRYAMGSVPVFTGGLIYLAGETGVCAVDIKTGKDVLRFDTDFSTCTDPVVVDGIVYFGCEDGYVYTVK
jgi:outer membrane protein assembly factor BamB